MVERLFHLDWHRCPDGYRIEQIAPVTTGLLIERHDGYDVIVARSDKTHPTNGILVDGLWRQLADVNTPEKALNFVTNHGFLDHSQEERVSHVLENATRMRAWAKAIDARDWPTITASLDQAGKGNRFFSSGGVGNLGVTLHYQEGMEQPELRLRPANLTLAILIQALDDAASLAHFKKCKNPGCPEWFRYGPGTDHRSSAEYHATSCKDAHAYAKRKEAAK